MATTPDPNPVHYAEEPTQNELDFPNFNDWGGPGWYFWDETWSRRMGPYGSEEQAIRAMRLYAETL